MRLVCIRRCVGLLVASVVTAATAQTSATQMKAAVQQAIEHGQATFWASAPVAENANQAMGRPPGGRVKVALQTRQRFNADCARINARFSDESGNPMFDMQMNICKDGSAPFEGVDLAQPVIPEDATQVPRLRVPLQGSR